MSAKGVAIVTGAAQGIGREIALRLAADGYDVSLNDVPAKKAELEMVAEFVRREGRKPITIFGDVSKEEDVQKLVQQTVDELGGLDVVGNASSTHFW